MTADLRRLLSEATPGPWRCDERVGVVAIYAGPERGCLANDEAMIHVSSGQWIDDAWHLSRKAVADAEAMAALRNQAEDLLAVVDAARKAAGANHAPMTIDGPVYRACACAVHGGLWDALDKLDAGRPA